MFTLKKITGLYSKATLFKSANFNSSMWPFFCSLLMDPKCQNSTASFLWKTSSS